MMTFKVTLQGVGSPRRDVSQVEGVGETFAESANSVNKHFLRLVQRLVPCARQPTRPASQAHWWAGVLGGLRPHGERAAPDWRCLPRVPAVERRRASPVYFPPPTRPNILPSISQMRKPR